MNKLASYSKVFTWRLILVTRRVGTESIKIIDEDSKSLPGFIGLVSA